MAIRLNRYLSESGFCSRREADGIIAAGVVTVNGRIGEFNSRISPTDVVAVEGERVMPRRAIDFTPKEAPKPRRISRREPVASRERVDKVPEWLKVMREKKPELTPVKASSEKREAASIAKPKPKVKPSVNSKKYTPKKRFSQ